MHWLQTFDAARRKGGHAFLFTGATGDAFPPASLRDDEPTDTLASLEHRVREHVCAGTDALAWVFDPVRGFSFSTSTDEQTFRKLAGLPVEAPPGDAIGQATRGVAEAVPLPTDPLAATQLIREILEAATRGKPARRCVTIFPHADVLVPATDATGGTKAATLAALALLQLIADDRLRRAGHLIVFMAPTAASIHELLRRADGPLTTIVIGKPTEAERLAFVHRCCSPDVDMLQRRYDATASGIKTLRQREQEHISSELAVLEGQASTHDVRRGEILEQDPAYQAAARAHEAAREIRVQALHEHDASAAVRHRALTEEQQQITARFRAKDLTLVSEPMNAETWLRLRPGDVVRCLTAEQRFTDFVVLSRLTGGRCVFGDPASHNTEPLAANGIAVIEWNWKGSAITGKVGTVERELEVPGGTTTILRVPSERHQIERRLAAINAELAALTTVRRTEATRVVHTVNDDVTSTARTLERETTRALGAWEPEAQRLKSRIMALTAERAHPVTTGITELEQRLLDLERQLNAAKHRGGLQPPAMGIDAFVRVTQSLGYRDVAVLLRDPEANEAAIKERRVALLNRAYGHLFEVIEPRYGFEGLSGLAHVKRILTGACQAMLRGDLKAVPQGIVFMGPPGTGKTAIAIAVAWESGMLLLKFRNFRNMWIGKTEELLEQMCYALIDLAPNVCFRDETDQEDSGRDAFQGDSGVSARIRQKLMEFEADERIRGRVLFLKATNRPDLMDPAMKRDGRADERIVVTTGEAEYAGLFPVYVRREGFPCDITDFTPLTARVRERGFSGAAVLNICRRAYVRGGNHITMASLADAIEDAVPSADRIADAKMTLAAIQAVSDRRNLPDDIDRIIANAKAALREAPRTAPYGVAPRVPGAPGSTVKS